MCDIQTPALRSIGNIVTGNDHQTQLVIDARALTHFNFLLNHPRSNIQKVLNFSTFLLHCQYYAKTFKYKHKGEIDLETTVWRYYSLPAHLQEGAWSISNITAGQPAQIQAVIDAGLVSPIIDIIVKVSFVCTQIENVPT